MHRLRSVLPAALALTLVASVGCGDGLPDFDLDGGSAPGTLPADADDVFSVLSRGGEVKLGLTDRIVYFRLSDATLADADRELARTTEGRDGVARRVAATVTKGLSRALRTRISWDVDDIRDIHLDGGRLVLEFEDPGRDFGKIEVDGDDVREAFSEDDARAFIGAFREVKRGR